MMHQLNLCQIFPPLFSLPQLGGGPGRGITGKASYKNPHPNPPPNWGREK